MLLLIIVVILIVAICIPILRTIVGIAILVGMIYGIIKFFWNLFRGHTIPTAIETLLKIAIFLAFAFVFLRTLIFAMAWYGGV